MQETLTARQLNAYLDRVGLPAAPDSDAAGLHELHHAQFFNIPFENFDIPLGRGIDLSSKTVFEKMVMNRRGGYCFELNGLMLRVLKTLGFDAHALLARVHLADTPSGKTHQLNLVQFASEQWVIDVGFGAGGPRAPLPLHEGITTTDLARYELVRVEPWGWLLRTFESGSWKDSYSFELGHVTAADIELGNHYTSTSASSHFTRLCVASLPTSHGRISLRNYEFTEIDESGMQSRTVAAESYLDLLRESFGIDLPSLPLG